MAERRLIPLHKQSVSTEIAQIAKEYGIPLEDARGIAQAFGIQDLDQAVPPELFRAVAEVMAFVYQLDQFSDTQKGRR